MLIKGIATIAPVKRGCYFEGEKNLTLFKVQNFFKKSKNTRLFDFYNIIRTILTQTARWNVQF